MKRGGMLVLGLLAFAGFAAGAQAANTGRGAIERVQVWHGSDLRGSVVVNGTEIHFGPGWGCFPVPDSLLPALTEAAASGSDVRVAYFRSRRGFNCLWTINLYPPR